MKKKKTINRTILKQNKIGEPKLENGYITNKKIKILR
jgi:hypothetical protein